jgi:serine protease Do
MKKPVIGLALLTAGLVFGMVLSARLSVTQPGIAAPYPIEQSRGAAAVTSGALPDLSAIAERAIQASVNISSTQTYRQQNDPLMAFFFGGNPRGYTERQAQSLGSGVIVSADGYIITNNHVVQDRNAKIVVTLPDNREVSAAVVGLDEVTDLAILKVDAKGLAPLPWGDSTKLRVAEWVLAIGNPFAFNETVTLGIVSAVNRHNPQLATYNDMIQTDAAINPGNSGGALVNGRGELIGINTMIVSRTGGYQGLGFAIPANLAQRTMQTLIKTGEVVYGDVGFAELATVDPAAAERAGLGRIRGVFVQDMYRGPAYQAGVRPRDIIIRFNGKDVTDAAQLERLILEAPVGSKVKIEVTRNGQIVPFTVLVEKMQGR